MRARGPAPFLPPVLVPAARRRPVLTAAAAGLVVAAAIGVRYRGDDGPGRLDRLVDPVLDASAAGAPHGPLWYLVLLGEPTVTLLLMGLLAGGLLLARRPRAALLALVGPGVAAFGARWVVRPLVGRTLDGTLAYPSGHTVTVTAVTTVVLVLLAGSRRPADARSRRALLAVVALVPVAVALALVALDLHYTTDVVGGAGFSVGVVLATAVGLDVVIGAAVARSGADRTPERTA